MRSSPTFNEKGGLSKVGQQFSLPVTSPLQLENNKQLIQRNFGRHARHYDYYAEVQNWMAQQLLQRIQNLPVQTTEISSILEIGCGTGLLTEKLHRLYPQSRILAFDLTEKMITIARKKVPQNKWFILSSPMPKIVIWLTVLLNLLFHNLLRIHHSLLSSTSLSLTPLFNGLTNQRKPYRIYRV
ncbi:methyltransferase domain-containing protein [Heliobacillus mobilis]|uniref:Methyltransferase domain-containing protein n=1 Tax=Heliobacterium mobile TaxID=28064 RepID=A0A6I3SFH1_HELMO|nr:methyltransferase domain-containing protein [Heliobacterium mobile]